ncbi:MAG: hypothetical protein BGO49_14230 [Planctomycetales bacterium 71-10]|nr:MAG: hypothetical protein BGO49_14230 [Planctomycetales bacterium 71-10]
MKDEQSEDIGISPPMARPEADPSKARAWAACVLAGVAAGLIGFGVGEAGHDAFQPRSVKQHLGQGEVDRPTPETMRRAVISNSSLAYGAWGGVLGIALGLAGGMLAGRAGRPAAGAVVGAVAAGLAGAILPPLVVPIAHRARFEMGVDPMIAGSASLLAMWAVVAAAASLGFAVGGRRSAFQSVVAALLGAIGGTVIYLAASTFLYPLAETDQPMPLVWQARLLARLLPALGAAALLATVRPRVAREAVAG